MIALLFENSDILQFSEKTAKRVETTCLGSRNTSSVHEKPPVVAFISQQEVFNVYPHALGLYGLLFITICNYPA